MGNKMHVEQTSWSKPHSLEINEAYAGLQIELLEKYFILGDDLQLCFKLFPLGYPGTGDKQYKHWFVTNSDATWVVEFGEIGWGDSDNIVSVHSIPRTEYYSMALKNCEHVARYITTGSWFS